jgi:MSHA biogenesis protein MshN
MSVIHSVLTKLDARGAPAPAALGAMPALQPQSNAAARRLIVMSVLGIGAIGFVAFADWPAWLRSANAAQPVAPVAAIVKTVAAPAAIEAASAPASPSPPAPNAAPQAETIVAAPVVAVPTRAPLVEPVAAAPKEPRRVAIVAPAPAPAPAKAPAPAPAPATANVSTESAASVATTSVTAAPSIDKRAIAMNPAQRAVLLLRQAHESAQAGQPRAALAQARDALALDPALAGARLLAAVLEHETGASERAAQLLRDGLARDPRDGAQAMLLARVQIAQGDGSGALATLQQHPVRSAEADGLRGGILTQQGDYAGALNAYESAARQQPTNSMWWLGLGVALDGAGHAQRARQAYERALTIGLPRDDLTQYADRRLRGND